MTKRLLQEPTLAGATARSVEVQRPEVAVPSVREVAELSEVTLRWRCQASGRWLDWATLDKTGLG